MHELSIAESVIDQVEAAAAKEHAVRITRVSLSIGRLSGVERESLEFVFPMAAEGTAVEGASLDIEEIPARVKCSKCNAETEPVLPLVECAACKSTDVNIVGGRELFIKSIEIES